MLLALLAICAVTGSILLCWGVVEEIHPRLLTEIQLLRAFAKLKRRRWQALEDFKREVRAQTRR